MTSLLAFFQNRATSLPAELRSAPDDVRNYAHLLIAAVNAHELPPDLPQDLLAVLDGSQRGALSNLAGEGAEGSSWQPERLEVTRAFERLQRTLSA